MNGTAKEALFIGLIMIRMASMSMAG